MLVGICSIIKMCPSVSIQGPTPAKVCHSNSLEHGCHRFTCCSLPARLLKVSGVPLVLPTPPEEEVLMAGLCGTHQIPVEEKNTAVWGRD